MPNLLEIDDTRLTQGYLRRYETDSGLFVLGVNAFEQNKQLNKQLRNTSIFIEEK